MVDAISTDLPFKMACLFQTDSPYQNKNNFFLNFGIVTCEFVVEKKIIFFQNFNTFFNKFNIVD